MGIWLGAYGPRMMTVTGRLADGWLPSVPRLPPDEVAGRHAAIDEAARRADRNPEAIVRAVNLALAGEPASWADHVLRAHEDLRFTVFVLSADDGGDPVGLVRRLGEDVAPRVREALGQPPGGR